MKIIIVGIGKVGYAIAEQMTGENHDLVVIDRNNAVLDHVDSMLDVMCGRATARAPASFGGGRARGGPSHRRFGKRRGQPHLLPDGEKKLGAKHTVARVRNPEYFRDAQILRREIGLGYDHQPRKCRRAGNFAHSARAVCVQRGDVCPRTCRAHRLSDRRGRQPCRQVPHRLQPRKSQQHPHVRGQARGRGHRAERLVRPADGRPRVRHRHARGDDARAALDGQGHGAHPPREHPWRQPHRTVPCLGAHRHRHARDDRGKRTRPNVSRSRKSCRKSPSSTATARITTCSSPRAFSTATRSSL